MKESIDTERVRVEEKFFGELLESLFSYYSSSLDHYNILKEEFPNVEYKEIFLGGTYSLWGIPIPYDILEFQKSVFECIELIKPIVEGIGLGTKLILEGIGVGIGTGISMKLLEKHLSNNKEKVRQTITPDLVKLAPQFHGFLDTFLIVRGHAFLLSFARLVFKC